MTTLSILDLAPIVAGRDAADALRRCQALAQQAEACGTLLKTPTVGVSRESAQAGKMSA